MWNITRTSPVSRAAWWVGVSACALASACATQVRVATPPPDTAPTSYSPNPERGAVAFQSNCATCHGENARGSERGPALIHRVYRSSHHSDMAFYKAVQRGVHAHHWNFGNMPAIAGVDVQTTADIIAYVRRAQAAAGIDAVRE